MLKYALNLSLYLFCLLITNILFYNIVDWSEFIYLSIPPYAMGVVKVSRNTLGGG